jgi:alanyl-tRNA synthetase
MDSGTIRQKFLDFFAGKGHSIVPSAPLVLKNDPTLLFTNSGMVQFKDYFLGNAVPSNNRIADTQKCLRVSGKHNDLEEVGIDTYHHTMFEMLGNWSFGDYFKKEAIAWAWELLTVEYRLPVDRLYVTVFGGDEADKLPVDEDAYNFWKTVIDEDRILYGSKKDNFWEMGETGPCGPCSEIHIDLRPDDEIKLRAGKSLVNESHPQVIEIWNLVFMEFNRKAGGALEKLPAQHVDTGMGFERLCMAIQQKTSNYDTDVFTPLLDFIAQACGIRYHSDEKSDIAMRVMADHVRAVAFAITDGQLPSNTGAGYVIRRILRRAVRYGYTFLNFKEPFLYRLVPVLGQQFRQAFPELEAQRDYVLRVILEEETTFLRTLEKGLRRLESIESSLVNGTVSGEQAFELYDTFGFPLDLTSLIARERGFKIDEAGFQVEMEKQKNRSKADAAKETGDWVVVAKDGKTSFIGYDSLEGDVRVVKYRKVKQKNNELFQLVFDQTPFYAESGGQEGDIGYIESVNERIVIVDTKKENELIIHFAEKLPASLQAQFSAVVNPNKRQLTMNNHSATHLLHAALRLVLGKHVEQKGSLVNEKVLRFDFSHFAAMTGEEIEQVEDLVNTKIRENIALDERRNVPIAEARAMGAMALFGEKYGDSVRVITFDPNFSVELCGGTHVRATGQIGMFRIVSESSVAAGVRRIEAVTAIEAEHYVRNAMHMLEQVKGLLKHPKDLVASTRNLLEERHTLEKKVEAYQQEQANTLKDQLAAKAVTTNGHSVIIERVSVPNAEVLKNIAYGLRNQFDNLVMVLAAEVDSKPQVAVMIGEALARTNVFHAGNMVKELAKEIDGGGGGQPFFATAGGKKLEGLSAVIQKAHHLVNK